MKHEVVIYLFDGFYESFSADILARFEENTGETGDQLKLAQGFVRSLSSKIEVPLEFVRLQSPKEYNFYTDQIFCLVEEKELRSIWKEVRKNHKHESFFEDTLHEKLKPGDGFVPFYSDDPMDWLAKDFSDFDCCELGIILLAYCRIVDVSLDDILEDPTYYGALE